MGRLIAQLFNSKRAGFTLIELLVVVSVIALLATLVAVSLKNSQAKARDAKRLADLKQVQTALDLYYDSNGNYPTSDMDGCGGWDVGNQTLPFMSSKLDGFMNEPPEDPMATGNCAGYRYYRYNAGSYGCAISKGEYYVLGVTDLESVSGAHEASPGWSCPGRDWQGEMEWVTGSFRY